jgi:hypothetical protein
VIAGVLAIVALKPARAAQAKRRAEASAALAS